MASRSCLICVTTEFSICLLRKRYGLPSTVFIVGSAEWKNFFSRYSGCIGASSVGGGRFTAFFFVKIFIAVTAGGRIKATSNISMKGFIMSNVLVIIFIIYTILSS